MCTRSQPEQIIIFNTESLYWYQRNEVFYKSVLNSKYICIDGIGLKLFLKIKGIDKKRYHGPDLMHDLLTSKKIKSALIIGGSDAAQKGLRDKYNFIKLSFISGEIDTVNVEKYIEKILSEEIDIIFVCLGIIKQEIFAQKVMKIIKKNNYDPSFKYIIGVGAAIDFLGQTKKRSSIIYQKFGLEWLPRLIREPRMLIRIIRSMIALITSTKYVSNRSKYIQELDDLEI